MAQLCNSGHFRSGEIEVRDLLQEFALKLSTAEHSRRLRCGAAAAMRRRRAVFCVKKMVVMVKLRVAI